MVPLRCCLIAILLLLACYNTDPPCPGCNSYNQPPDVWLAAGPPEGSTVANPVHFYWGGWDSDGAISGFEYLFTQNHAGSLSEADTIGVPWAPVRGNDSTFTFEPDSLNTSRSFTFFIRAIDNEGLRSHQTAHRTFSISEPVSAE